jgi:hypothetical protein
LYLNSRKVVVAKELKLANVAANVASTLSKEAPYAWRVSGADKAVQAVMRTLKFVFRANDCPPPAEGGATSWSSVPKASETTADA